MYLQDGVVGSVFLAVEGRVRPGVERLAHGFAVVGGEVFERCETYEAGEGTLRALVDVAKRVSGTYSGLISLVIWANPEAASAVKPPAPAAAAASERLAAFDDVAMIGATAPTSPTRAVAQMSASSAAKLGSFHGKNVRTSLSTRSVKSSWPLVIPSW